MAMFTVLSTTQLSVSSVQVTEGVLKVARRVDRVPRRCVYIGDSTGDMKAAAAAGMRGIGVGWGNKTVAELQEAGAETVCTAVDELLGAATRIMPAGS